MEFEIENQNINNFKEKVIQLDNGINVLLDEFKKLYVIVNMHPTNQEYQQQYQNTINNLSSILSKMFSISNNLQLNVDNINKKLLKYDILIRKERKRNRELKVKLGVTENKNNAAFEMIDDYKDIYDKRYLRNWSLILSSIVGIIAIGMIYKKQRPVV